VIRGIRKDETGPFPGIGSGTEKRLSGRGEDRRQFLLVVISSCPLACIPVITKLPASWWKRDDLLEKALNFNMKAQPGITRTTSGKTCLDMIQQRRAPRYRGRQPLDHAFGSQFRFVRRDYPNSDRDVLEGQWRTDPDLQTSCLQIRDVRVALPGNTFTYAGSRSGGSTTSNSSLSRSPPSAGSITCSPTSGRRAFQSMPRIRSNSPGAAEPSRSSSVQPPLR
jgi:hypothetical protein